MGRRIGQEGSEELEQEVPARFVLVFDHLAGFSPGSNPFDEGNGAILNDLVFFCGTDQRKHPTPEFLTGLKDIAARADTKILPRGNPGLDVKIPIQVAFSDGGRMSSRQFSSIINAEKTIKEKWRIYDQSSGNSTVESRTIRCTFELGPMIVNRTDTFGYYSLAPKLQKMVRQDNVWFSKITLSPGCGDAYDGRHKARDIFRELVTAVFDFESRSPQRASTQLYSDRGAYIRDGSPLQVNHVEFTSYTGMNTNDFSAILSAMVINQTVKKFSIRSEKRAIANSKQWKWLAYGLFSKRARAYSALESTALNQIDSLSDTDVAAFLSVLNSAHSEEALCGTPAGVVEEKNATLKSGSSIQWCFSRGQPVVDGRHKRIKVESAIRCVRTFSDDGESEWVNAMIPGLGRCQVQRDDLIFDLSSVIETRPGALKTLTIGFNREEDTYPRSDGLPQFLAAIGSTLKNLTLDGPRQEIDENVIIRNCPNLHKLALCGGIVDVQLDFSDYRYNNLPVPQLQQCHWHDVRALAADLSDVNNPLSKIVRRLRLRLNDRCKGWRHVEGGYGFDNLPEDIKVILRMLSVNRHLAYLDVFMLTDHRKYGNALKK